MPTPLHRYTSFSRSFQLPKGAKPDQITANCEHGVLSLNVPGEPAAVEEPKTRQIKVQ
jgi:HSP20 family molecular chaperone IbpA